jgi:nitrate reductase alpha subunit
MGIEIGLGYFQNSGWKFSELAPTHLPEPVRDLVAMPLQHDTPAEMAQAHIRDWAKGECEPIPGVTMPNFIVTERDYVNLGKRFISFGPNVQKEGLAIHGIHWDVADLYRANAGKQADGHMER